MNSTPLYLHQIYRQKLRFVPLYYCTLLCPRCGNTITQGYFKGLFHYDCFSARGVRGRGGLSFPFCQRKATRGNGRQDAEEKPQRSEVCLSEPMKRPCLFTLAGADHSHSFPGEERKSGLCWLSGKDKQTHLETIGGKRKVAGPPRGAV